MTSPVFQTSGFPIAAIIWLEKMVTMKTVYGRIKVLRVFAHLLRGMWRIRAVCQRFSSRKCLHDFFSLKVFGAYMQVLDGRELLISATTEGASFLS